MQSFSHVISLWRNVSLGLALTSVLLFEECALTTCFIQRLNESTVHSERPERVNLATSSSCQPLLDNHSVC